MLRAVLPEAYLSEAGCPPSFSPEGLKRLMPVYDFKFRECGQLSEILLRDHIQKACCPNCGGENLERLFSASYLIKTEAETSATTCCGRAERCGSPPCSTGDMCRRA